MFWFVLALIVAALVWYVMAGRAWLKAQPWAQSFFAWIEPVEIALYKKSETLLAARALWLGGTIVTFYDAAAVFMPALDWTPVTDRLLSKIPTDLRGLVVTGAIAAIGLLIGWLRKRISKPLEIVALPDKVPDDVAAVVDMAEAAKVAAVATAKEAKAEGKV